MKLPAYAKPLIKARSSGREPWLISVAIGKLRDTVLLAGVAGVSRIGWSDIATVRQAQWSLLVGANVMISLFVPPRAPGEPDPTNHILSAIWSIGRPGTLWVAGDKESWYLNVWPRGRDQFDFEPSREAYPLNAGLRAAVINHRRTCLLVGNGVFSRAEFDPVRVEALAAITAPPGHAAG